MKEMETCIFLAKYNFTRTTGKSPPYPIQKNARDCV